MYRLYLVTGATGFLGNTVVRRLAETGASIRALVMPGDPLAGDLPDGVEAVAGRVDDRASLEPFFAGVDGDVCVIHCAGIISIATKTNPLLWAVNVGGTRNVTDLCAERGVGRLVYVSSVHAIPEKPKGETITETDVFDPKLVDGDYAKSKAAATAYVLAAAKGGLNACVVHPSGIVGPGDRGCGSITGMVNAYRAGKLRVGVRGGYDFVDVRDVADGIVACCEKGRPGECYILANRYISVRELLETLRARTHGKRILFCAPLWMAKLVAPICERYSLRRGKPPFFTPYAIATLGTNARFSHDKAVRELGVTFDRAFSDIPVAPAEKRVGGLRKRRTLRTDAC